MLKINCAVKNEARDIFRQCFLGYRDQDLKQRMKDAIPLIHESEVLYRSVSVNHKWCSLNQSDTVGGYVTKDEMIDLYDNKLVKQGSPGRGFYNKIKASAEHNLCPLCLISEVYTLDHYLPKSKYPALAVTPINLIPACYACNFEKANTVPNQEGLQTLHPYYDDVSDERWIYAKLLEGEPLAFQFYVQSPEHWPDTLKKRVATHFKVYRLASRLPSHANSLYHDMKDNLYDAYLERGVDGLVKDLESKRNSCFKKNKNNWKGAVWDALLESDWFRKDGVRNITDS